MLPMSWDYKGPRASYERNWELCQGCRFPKRDGIGASTSSVQRPCGTNRHTHTLPTKSNNRSQALVKGGETWHWLARGSRPNLMSYTHVAGDWVFKCSLKRKERKRWLCELNCLCQGPRPSYLVQAIDHHWSKNENPQNYKLASRIFARILQKMGNPVFFANWKVMNMVRVAETPFKINLTMLDVEHKRCSSWEPEIFPGLVYKILEPKTTLIIFSSRKVYFLVTRSCLPGLQGDASSAKTLGCTYDLLSNCTKALFRH